MAKYVALLRGINMFGKTSIRMAALQEWIAELGFDAVETYIQSGNLVFETRERSAPKIGRAIRAAILERSSFDVPVMIRTRREFAAAAAANPFRAAAARDPKSVCVGFLSAKPKAAGLEALRAIDARGDRFECVGREIYLHFRNGSARTKLLSIVIERKLGVDATLRNWRTMQKLCEMAGG